MTPPSSQDGGNVRAPAFARAVCVAVQVVVVARVRRRSFYCISCVSARSPPRPTLVEEIKTKKRTPPLPSSPKKNAPPGGEPWDPHLSKRREGTGGEEYPLTPTRTRTRTSSLSPTPAPASPDLEPEHELPATSGYRTPLCPNPNPNLHFLVSPTLAAASPDPEPKPNKFATWSIPYQNPNPHQSGCAWNIFCFVKL